MPSLGAIVRLFSFTEPSPSEIGARGAPFAAFSKCAAAEHWSDPETGGGNCHGMRQAA